MDTRVELLDQFYQTMRHDRVKLEARNFGFEFVDQLMCDDGILDYIQMENKGVHKYRLLNISKESRTCLLQKHVDQKYNVCLYFDKLANNTICFNLDNNFRENNNEIIPELALAASCLEKQLALYDMEALTVKSGRGYHQWCRFEEPIINQQLIEFMIRIAAKTLAALHYENHNYHAVKINMSPNPKFVENISLRAFGSRHIRTGSFSFIQAHSVTLNESDSWQYFQDYMIHKTISKAKFAAAYADLTAMIPL